MSQFVHLHLHTDYSLLDGACDVEKLCEHVQQLGMPAVAMTDHGNIFGAVHFVNAAHKHGVKPIVGCELYVRKKDDHRAAGVYLFVPHGYDGGLIAQCGLQLLECEDVKAKMAKSRRRGARPAYREVPSFAKSKAIRHTTASRKFLLWLLVLPKKAAFPGLFMFRVS